MFGSFLGATLGRICQLAAVVMFFVMVSNHVPALVILAVCAGMVVFGSYLVYLSRHTVRVRD